MRSAWVLVFGGCLALSGCAGHTWTMEGVREALRQSDLDEARARLADAGRGTDDLLFALEDGLLLHYACDPDLSNSRFEFVEQRIDDLYTKSISRAALSLITSDLVLRFQPHGIESFLVNYYKGMNYLQLDDPPESAVEWRKLASKLQFSREQGDQAYLDPPFFNHVVGLGLELDDPGNAYVAMRLAEAGYLAAGRTPPGDLVDDLVRLASRLGFADHLDLYRERYGEVGDWPANRAAEGEGRAAASVRDDWGEIVIFVEEGLVAPIHETPVFIPITEARSKRVVAEGREAQLQLAEELAFEYEGGRFDGTRGVYLDGRELAYVLPMSFPVYGAGEALFDRLAVTAAAADTAWGRIALDVTALQGEAYADRLLGIYAKTIARALIKYAAASKLEEVAEEEGGEVAGDVVGVLANVVNVVTERADTRAWLGLPTRIWMARLRVPPGDHDLHLLLGGEEEMILGPIDVRPFERRIINHRFF
jgi:hypothetical protein